MLRWSLWRGIKTVSGDHGRNCNLVQQTGDLIVLEMVVKKMRTTSVTSCNKLPSNRIWCVKMVIKQKYDRCSVF